MPKKHFNPHDWYEEPTPPFSLEKGGAEERGGGFDTADSRLPTSSSNYQKVLQIISQIQSTGTDIAPAYGDWRNIGFAFADEFGESGRDLFHQVSQNYPDYTPKETDQQYTRCLNSRGYGITIGTFFYWAHRSGLSINNPTNKCGAEFPSSIRRGGSLEQRDGVVNPSSLGEVPVGGWGINSSTSDSMTAEQGKMSLEQKGTNSSTFEGKVPIGRKGISSNHQINASSNQNTSCFAAQIYTSLPPFLKQIVDSCSNNHERDLMLIGSLVTLSTSLDFIYGIYDGNKVYPNLFLFVSAPASAGKGRLVHCRQLLLPLHNELRNQTHKLKKEIEKSTSNKKDQAKNKVAEKLVFIPANTSATGVFQLLSDNNGSGIIFETEGDTLSLTFKSDYGNYSDGFRKAFHHESISFYRRMDREYVDIVKPRLSAVLSGTPKQISTLISDVENGLFSRFIFFTLPLNREWKDVFSDRKINNMDDYYYNLGLHWQSKLKTVEASTEIHFQLTPQQQLHFNQQLNYLQNKYLEIHGEEFLPTIRRFGIITFRLAMILTGIRSIEKNFPQLLSCSDNDFKISISLLESLLQHTSGVYASLNCTSSKKGATRKLTFIRKLPETFNRQTYLTLADELNIPRKSADRYIQEALKSEMIFRLKLDHYSKLKPP